MDNNFLSEDDVCHALSVIKMSFRPTIYLEFWYRFDQTESLLKRLEMLINMLVYGRTHYESIKLSKNKARELGELLIMLSNEEEDNN